jgi:hypothetical protein
MLLIEFFYDCRFNPKKISVLTPAKWRWQKMAIADLQVRQERVDPKAKGIHIDFVFTIIPPFMLNR